MAKQFQKSSAQFDSDLDAILDRVYGKKSDSTFDPPRAVIPPSFTRNDQGSKELKEALAELRNRRERAQGSMRLLQMQDEIDYLRGQIDLLRNLGDQIDQLRQRVALEAELGTSLTLPDPREAPSA